MVFMEKSFLCESTLTFSVGIFTAFFCCARLRFILWFSWTKIQHSPSPSVCAGKKKGADFVHSRKSGHPKLFKGNSSSDTDFWRKKSADSFFPSVKGLRVTIKLRDFYVSVNFVFSVFFGSEVTTKGPVWEAADVADIYLRGLRLNQTPLLTKPTFLVLVVRFPPGDFFYHMRTQWIFSD